MAQRAKERPSDELRVMVIDEDEFHANSAKSMLSELNYYVTIYTSPIEALGVLEKKAQDVDFILAAVHMEELNGFDFLEAAKDVHKNLQVIMMSTETTMFTMKRSIELGARFLAKKPLDASTIQNMWQHLDVKVLSLNRMNYLSRGVRDKARDGQEVGNSVAQHKDGTGTTTHLIWTPYLESKFLYALQILGPNASPSKIKIIMNVNNVGRALQLGAVFDESQYSTDPSSEEPYEVIAHIMGEDGILGEAHGSNSHGQDQVVAQTYNPRAAQEITSKNNYHDDQVSNISKAPVVGLVDYPDSEDFDEVEIPIDVNSH